MDETARLILASTSSYRRNLLRRLHLPFTVETPDFDEALPGSMPVETLIRHNTLGKARSVAMHHPEAWVIGADQLAVCGNEVLGKPGSVDAACTQLQKLSGRRVDFLTGVALLGPCGEHFAIVPFRVHFRELSEVEIRTYVSIEQPWGCTGSFKSEGLGISLFERLEGDDPTALIGLPLICLSGWLQPLRRQKPLRNRVQSNDTA